MAIPKQIFQTFKTDKLSWFTRFYIKKMQRKNPEYTYYFFDDEAVDIFIKNEYPNYYYNAYKRLTIGAAKADFFRYAILLKRGGIYLDIDGYVKSPFDMFLKPEDTALISMERNPGFFCQWALFFDKNHPFLEKTMEKMIDNIQTHRYPNDVHRTTGPSVYRQAIEEVLAQSPETPHRLFGIDYEGHVQPKYKLSKFFVYGKKSEHWRAKQKSQDIISPFEQT